MLTVCVTASELGKKISKTQILGKMSTFEQIRKALIFCNNICSENNCPCFSAWASEDRTGKKKHSPHHHNTAALDTLTVQTNLLGEIRKACLASHNHHYLAMSCLCMTYLDAKPSCGGADRLRSVLEKIIKISLYARTELCVDFGHRKTHTALWKYRQ